METKVAYDLFDQLINSARSVLMDFTLSTEVTIEKKADKSLVTACDIAIDNTLSKIAFNAGFQVVSEEGEKALRVAQSGNYLTIDPIDGSLGYIDYLNAAALTGIKRDFLSKDLGAKSDFCLLLGIVEDNKARFGAVYNYITKEKIFVDSQDPQNLVRENVVRVYYDRFAAYVDQRPGDWVEDEIKKLKDVSIITQATVGLKSIYTILNDHESAITCHRVQTSGLWDIMPAAVATNAFGGQIYDDKGNVLKLNEYIILPGKGTTIVKGNKFNFVLDLLKK